MTYSAGQSFYTPPNEINPFDKVRIKGFQITIYEKQPRATYTYKNDYFQHLSSRSWDNVLFLNNLTFYIAQ